MTPEVPAVLSELAQLLARNAAPGVPDAERSNALTLASMLLALAAEKWDGAAETLVQENRALASLLGDRAAEESLRLSALRAENARLKPANRIDNDKARKFAPRQDVIADRKLFVDRGVVIGEHVPQIVRRARAVDKVLHERVELLDGEEIRA